MPRMPLCGGFRIGVESSEPNTPPLEMVNVPPLMSSMVSVPSRAFAPNSAIRPSIPANDIVSTLRRIGTTSPRGEPTATPMSQ